MRIFRIHTRPLSKLKIIKSKILTKNYQNIESKNIESKMFQI
ncbi:hypothetical protein [Helicobacter saguini]|nr:hypothetical protein [Helicobacter saguini]